MPSASEMIVQFLEEAGVEYVFGIPGGGTGQIFNFLHGKDDRIKTVLCRHEQTAAIMADATGRATGKPAVVMGQGLFIGSNATFGIMEAMLSSSPMLILTDTSDGGVAMHAANQSGAGEYGSIDLPSILKSMTKYTTLATNPKEAAIGTQLAIKHSLSGRPGPAAVVMRSAAIGGDVDMESPPFIHDTAGYLNTSKPQSAPQDIERAVEILSQSSRPVLVAGNGVHLSKSHAQLQQLAEMWGMPVATSYKGKSAIAETHPLSLGMVGVYGQDEANTAVGEADTVVVVGAKLTPQDTVRERPNTFDPRRQKIIQIDIDDRNAGKYARILTDGIEHVAVVVAVEGHLDQHHPVDADGLHVGLQLGNGEAGRVHAEPPVAGGQRVGLGVRSPDVRVRVDELHWRSARFVEVFLDQVLRRRGCEDGGDVADDERGGQPDNDRVHAEQLVG